MSLVNCFDAFITLPFACEIQFWIGFSDENGLKHGQNKFKYYSHQNFSEVVCQN